MKKLDISGPKGNAYCVLGLARNISKQIDKDPEELVQRMTSSDYNNLLTVFVEEFGKKSACPLVELVSAYELPGVDANLYTIEENDYI